MMHVDSLQRYWHRNKEQTLAADGLFPSHSLKAPRSCFRNVFLLHCIVSPMMVSIVSWSIKVSKPAAVVEGGAPVSLPPSSVASFGKQNKSVTLKMPWLVVFGFGRRRVNDKTRVRQQALNIMRLKETGMRKGGLHIKRGRRAGKQMMSSTYKFFICIGWLERLDWAPSRDLTTNPVCKLLFILGKVCQSWALIFPSLISLLWLALAHGPHIIYDCLWSWWQIIKSRISFLHGISPLGIGKAVALRGRSLTRSPLLIEVFFSLWWGARRLMIWIYCGSRHVVWKASVEQTRG